MSEQFSRRNQFITSGLFIRSFIEFVLTEEVLNHLYTDPQNPFIDLMPQFKCLPDVSSKKAFILTKFMEERHPVNYLAELMVKFDQPDIAGYLQTYNRSAPLIPYVYDLSLRVTPATVLRGIAGDSMRFRMDTNPKGFCLLVVNELKLLAEAKQLKSVFQQMGYDVSRTHKTLTCPQIDQLFDTVATGPQYKNYNSLVTIMIGHGENGLFVGADGQRIPITHLIDKFAKENCNFNNDSSKPKVHIFNCCRRRKSDKVIDTSKVDKTLRQAIDCFNPGWVNNNINTTIIYACAEGQPSRYSKRFGFSRFGRALTHTLAQYACERSLNELMEMLNKRLESDGVYIYPETIHFRDRWALYFNPGLPLDNDNSPPIVF